MSVRPGPASLVLFAIIVAGCTGGVPPTVQGGGSEFDDATGAVQGVVLDESLLPVGNVTLGLDAIAETTSREDGSFAFSRVPPGEYTLSGLKIGFESFARKVTVAVQEVTELRIQLVAVTIDVPYHETKMGNALVGCGTSIRQAQLNAPPAGLGGLHLCSSLPQEVRNATSLKDQMRLDWRLGSLEKMTGIYAESRWTSTQALGKGMRIRWYFGAPAPDIGPFLGEKDQGSPISFRFPVDLLRTNATITPVSTASGAAGTKDAASCLDSPCPFISFHYAGRNNLGPSYPFDFGVAFQQKLEDHLTAFYLEEFPETFTALPDS